MNIFALNTQCIKRVVVLTAFAVTHLQFAIVNLPHPYTYTYTNIYRISRNDCDTYVYDMHIKETQRERDRLNISLESVNVER